jgi:hypothetical protein
VRGAGDHQHGQSRQTGVNRKERMMEQMTRREPPTREEQREQLRGSAFGRVLTELLEERGYTVTPGEIGLLVERVGMDGWRVIDRMADAEARYVGRNMKHLADKLELDQDERERLARALAFEEE